MFLSSEVCYKKYWKGIIKLTNQICIIPHRISISSSYSKEFKYTIDCLLRKELTLDSKIVTFPIKNKELSNLGLDEIILSQHINNLEYIECSGGINFTVDKKNKDIRVKDTDNPKSLFWFVNNKGLEELSEWVFKLNINKDPFINANYALNTCGVLPIVVSIEDYETITEDIYLEGRVYNQIIYSIREFSYLKTCLSVDVINNILSEVIESQFGYETYISSNGNNIYLLTGDENLIGGKKYRLFEILIKEWLLIIPLMLYTIYSGNIIYLAVNNCPMVKEIFSNPKSYKIIINAINKIIKLSKFNTEYPKAIFITDYENSLPNDFPEIQIINRSTKFNGNYQEIIWS